MSHRNTLVNRRLAASIGGAAIVALAIGTFQAGCGSSSSGTGSGGSSGTGGMGEGTGGAGETGGAGGMGGSGGSSPTACKDEMIVIPADADPTTPRISTNTTWECNSYVLKGLTSIGNGATLTIAAGSKIIGDSTDSSNPAALIAKRDGKLIAIGTATKPIVFTSAFPPGQRMPGDSLAGVVMMGNAAINNGTCINDANPATPGCDAPGFLQSNIEGIAANDPRGQYGGADDTHNCGELRYVRVEFAGFLLGTDNELNGITVGGCGSATKISYVQVHRGFDDGIELFGGTANLDHILISGFTDDGLDWDNGWRGKAQFVIIHKAYSKGDKSFEGDNLGGAEESLPRSSPEIWNATLIGELGTPTIGMHLREGTRFKLRNFIVQDFGKGAVDVDAVTVVPAPEWPANISIENSIFSGGILAKDESTAAQNNDMGFDEAMALMDAARMNQFVDPMLTSTMISAPNYAPQNAAVSNQATPPEGFDTTANYAGAVKPGDPAPWYLGWTAFPEN